MWHPSLRSRMVSLTGSLCNKDPNNSTKPQVQPLQKARNPLLKETDRSRRMMLSRTRVAALDLRLLEAMVFTLLLALFD